MAGQNALNQIRQAFQIPDSVVILASTALIPPKAATAKKPQNFQIDQTDNRDKELYRSSLGTPVYTNITFQAGTYETTMPGKTVSYGPVTYEAILITVSQAKKIIKTEIQGRDGTVKEYIGMDDYQVQINGIITGKNGHFPKDEVAALKKVLDAPVPLEIACTYLETLDIHSLVVDQYEIGQQEGGYSYQTFSIACLSDVPQELRLANV